MKSVLLFNLITSKCNKRPIPSERKIYGVGYNAKHSDGNCPNESKVVDDFNTLLKVTDKIRTFGLFDCNQGELILKASQKTGMKVSLGMFVNQYSMEFEREFELLKRLVSNYKQAFNNVNTIIVGSESVYRKENTPLSMAQYIKRVKHFIKSEGLNILITTSDTKDMWYPSPMESESDVMFVNAYPYWEGVNINGAVDQLFEKIKEVQQRVPNKKIILSETGWPEEGPIVGQAVPSKENQIRYFNEFICRAKKEGLDYYWFSAFDEDWKQTEKNANWGIFKEGGILKPNYSLPLLKC